MDKQAYRQTDRQMDKQTDRWTNKQADREVDKSKQTYRQMDKQTGRQMDRQTENRQTDKLIFWTNRQTNIESLRQTIFTKKLKSHILIQHSLQNS